MHWPRQGFPMTRDHGLCPTTARTGNSRRISRLPPSFCGPAGLARRRAEDAIRPRNIRSRFAPFAALAALAVLPMAIDCASQLEPQPAEETPWNEVYTRASVLRVPKESCGRLVLDHLFIDL